MEAHLKRMRALDLLAKTSIWRSNYESPLVRFLWRLGFDVPPPHFASFAGVALLTGVGFGAAWGLLMWFLFWSYTGMSLAAVAFSAITAGVLFGIGMAGYYRYGRKKHQLPSWGELSA